MKYNILLIISFLYTTVFAQTTFRTVAPANGLTIPNNMPTLAWEKIKCDSFELWLDSRKVEVVPANQNAYVPFPLSFGKHNWKVVAIQGKARLNSTSSSFIVDDAALAEVPQGALLLRNGWNVKSSVETGMNGARLSKKGVNTNTWATTSLPATVLTALVRNGIYPNPYTALNNMRIPDSNNEYNKDYDLLKYSHIKGVNPWRNAYWFRNEFAVPKSFDGKNLWLTFSEINYKAQIWLNGKLIADTTEIKGMERSFRLNVNRNLKKGDVNCLAVAIFPVENPGKPGIEPIMPLSDPGQNMGDGRIATSYTKWDTMGWDWQPAVRDRDMGITEDVFLSATDDIELEKLYVTSDINLPDTTNAALTVSVNLKNNGSTAQNGIVKIKITNGKDIISFDENYSIPANSTKAFVWTPKNNPSLKVRNAKLWWPTGYGVQNLYNIKVITQTQSGQNSEITDVFGIRRIDTYIGKNERVYKINGREVYPKGGNWVIDMMLNWTATRYEREIMLTKNANLNMLRVWGPTGVAPKAFYRAADKYGILMWQDFLNDFWGTNRNTPGYQPDIKLFENASIQIVEKLRNHPSLVIWCGGNEGVNPREELLVNSVLKSYDSRDTRHFLKQSDGDGLHGGGPYHTLEPKDYFTHKKLQGFSSEIGPSGIPVLQSMQKFMPEIGKNWMPGRFPLDGAWAFHDANDWPGDDSRKFTSYDNMLRSYYGAPDTTNVTTGVADYISKAQLVNYDVYRAAIESINRQLWSNASGILLWKSNSSWPSITWQVYDWYMQAHAGYYGAKKAAGLMNIQFNRDNNSVSFLNLTSENLQNLTVSATLYDLNSQKVWEKSEVLSAGSNCTVKSDINVNVSEKAHFLKLTVTNKKGNMIADNFYWLESSNSFSALQQLPETKLAVEASMQIGDKSNKYIIRVKNIGNAIAFMFNTKIVGKVSQQELLPTLWNDNYISLLPGESKMLEAAICKEDITENPILEYATFGNTRTYKLEFTK
jgi:hypothetical protein